MNARNTSGAIATVVVLCLLSPRAHAGTIRHSTADEVYLNLGITFGNVGVPAPEKLAQLGLND